MPNQSLFVCRSLANSDFHRTRRRITARKTLGLRLTLSHTKPRRHRSCFYRFRHVPTCEWVSWGFRIFLTSKSALWFYMWAVSKGWAACRMLHGPEGCAMVVILSKGLAGFGCRFEVVQAHLSAILNRGCAALSCWVPCDQA